MDRRTGILSDWRATVAALAATVAAALIIFAA